MRVRCEHCGMDMEALPGSEGRSVRCPGCGGIFACRLPVAEIVEAIPYEQDGEVLLSEEIPEPDDLELTDELAEEGPAEPVETVDDVLARAVRDKPKRIVEENPRQWYVMVGGVAAVALTFEELRQRAAEGQLKPRAKIFYAPKDVTVRARDIPGLFGAEDAKRAEKAAKAATPAKPRRAAAPAGAAEDEAADLADALSKLEAAPSSADPQAPPDDAAAEALRKLGEALEEQ
ncbi:MAG TPA: hypothetical protein VM389_05155 [Phycisphaerae bacterium]|nr:hypothetical protein [Phycisphaerae bacterium]HUU21905.1 hypothetical protein [Phycisphaerae bacterium]